MKQTEAQAEKIRHDIITRLGPGWTGRVWENLGWHVAWHNGALKLHYEPRTKSYWAMVGDVDDSHGGHLDLARGKTRDSGDPVKAVMAACENAQKVFREKWEPIQFSVAKIVLELSGAKRSRSVTPETSAEVRRTWVDG